jgi:hypothetical protein
MPQTSSTIRVQATLLVPRGAEEGGTWTFMKLPKEAAERLPSRDGTMVEGTADGFPFRAPLEAGGIRLSRAQHKAIGASPGDAVTVEITRIGDQPEVRVPSDLSEALAAAPEASALWEDVTPMARREWVRWVASARQEETRKRRIEVGIDKLSKGMRRPCCFPGLNWVTKDHVSPEETWAPLPGSKAPKRA